MLLVALSAVVLLGFAGLAVDTGTLFREKRLLQTAADSAAIAGASQIRYSAVNSAAQADATANGYTNGVNNTTVTVNNPPLSGPYMGAANSNYVEVIVSHKSPTFFMTVFGISSMTVSARAVALLGSGTGCIVALDSSANQAFYANGNTTLNAPACGVSVDSNASNALYVNGSASVTNAGPISVVGGYVNKNGKAGITPSTGVSAVSDPLAYLSAPTGGQCTGGTYASGLSITGSYTFSGVYCFGGDLKIAGSGTLNSGGSGATLYFYNTASIKITGSPSFNMSAPTTGSYAGVLIYMNASDTSGMDLTGGNGGTLSGAIYVPGGPLSLGGSKDITLNSDIVADTINISGTSTVTVTKYTTTTSPISSLVLVE